MLRSAGVNDDSDTINDTVRHTFHECARSRKLWEWITHQWRQITGEGLIKATDPRVCLFGDRSMCWYSETDQSEFAQLEEAFAVIHKATLHVIKEERDRDAAPRAGKRRSGGAQLAASTRLFNREAESQPARRRSEPFARRRWLLIFRRWTARRSASRT